MKIESKDILIILITLSISYISQFFIQWNYIILIIGICLLIISITIYSVQWWRNNPVKKIVRLLEKYPEIKQVKEKERDITHRLGKLFPKLEEIGFGITSNGNTIENQEFRIHLTRTSPGSYIHQFYIENLRTSYRFYSQGYPDTARNNNQINVLNEFLTYIKEQS